MRLSWGFAKLRIEVRKKKILSTLDKGEKKDGKAKQNL
jgi:hypothetical protein